MSKFLVIGFLLAIIGSLGSGLFYLVRDTSDEKRTVRALTWRIVISLALVVFLVIAFFSGWLHPHGLRP
ncbi:MAG TPA: twin transmembrane helix small protein [Salinisphaeraceae bacterium]|nr:twin transmembrane helix small protein [Salinisphaeraceae bacterium]